MKNFILCLLIVTWGGACWAGLFDPHAAKSDSHHSRFAIRQIRTTADSQTAGNPPLVNPTSANQSSANPKSVNPTLANPTVANPGSVGNALDDVVLAEATADSHNSGFASQQIRRTSDSQTADSQTAGNPPLANPSSANPKSVNPTLANPTVANPGSVGNALDDVVLAEATADSHNSGFASQQIRNTADSHTAGNPALANPTSANPVLVNPKSANPLSVNPPIPPPTLRAWAAGMLVQSSPLDVALLGGVQTFRSVVSPVVALRVQHPQSLWSFEAGAGTPPPRTDRRSIWDSQG